MFVQSSQAQASIDLRRIMDSLFLLGDGDRAAFLQQMMQSFGCLHICLWSYLPHPSNCLLAMDGLFRETRNEQQQQQQQPSSSSSSSGNILHRLFDLYRESVNYVDTGRIPGFAFKNNLRYMELKLHDLQRMASHEVQLQFYQEAGIKTVVFMGCATGEIELGMSNDHPQVDLEKEMKNLFPLDFSAAMSGEIPNHPPSSSSSSLRSLSADSSDYSQLLFNINPTTPTASFVTQEHNLQESLLSTHHDTLVIRSSKSTTPLINSTTLPPALTLISPSTSSTNYPPPPLHHHHQHNLLLTMPPNISNPTAFRRYSPSRAANEARGLQVSCKQNMFKRSVLFLRNLSMRRRQDELQQVQGNGPTDTQLHHMISERKRREKLNDSFQVLRSLLPTGTKKDKVSVLSSTTEYLSSLKTEVAELSKRNQMLESQLSVHGLLSSKEDDPTGGGFSSADHQRLIVEMKHVSSSNSEARLLDLRVRVKSLGENNDSNNSMLDLVTRMLGFLKQQTSVSLSSVQSNTNMLESSFPVHEITMRLKIEGDEFDESGFGEAVRRVVDDQRH